MFQTQEVDVEYPLIALAVYLACLSFGLKQVRTIKGVAASAASVASFLAAWAFALAFHKIATGSSPVGGAYTGMVSTVGGVAFYIRACWTALYTVHTHR